VKRVAIVCAAVGYLAISRTAGAYETVTHGLLSSAAARQSLLAVDNTLLSGIGLPPLNGSTAPDGSTITFHDSANGTGTALVMIMNGAVLEDSSYTLRPLNHFYDPQYHVNGVFGRGLAALRSGNASPDWALGDTGEPPDLNTSQINLNSYRRAEQYFYAALTGSDLASRTASYSLMFQSLGQVIHHIQDMAQPQHVRNDSHFHEPWVPSLLTPWGFYETYTQSDKSAQTSSQAAIDSMVNSVAYGTPDFQFVRQYWYSPGNPQPAYLGMAEYTAGNFVSSGTEFVATAGGGVAAPAQFPYPTGAGTAIQRLTETVTYANNTTQTGPVDYVVGNVYDAYSGITTSHRLAARSLLDPYARSLGATGLWTENTSVFNNNYSALLPRAVGFSAGLINHFFRGRVNLTRLSASSLTWNITNVSTSPNGAMSGTFKLYAENSSHIRSAVPGGVWSLNLAKGGTSQVAFNDPPVGTQYLVLVFNGSIGGEPTSSDSNWYATAGTVVKYTPPPSTCTAPRTDQGSSAGVNYTRDLGTVAGKVDVQFEAFSIPDGLVVKSANSAGTVLATTHGLVSGLHTFNFNFDPLNLGSTSINVVVTGNTDSGTAWNVVTGCPGQPLTTGNGALPQETVKFSFGAALTGSLGSCIATVYIDGNSIGSAYADSSSPHTLSANLTIGQGHGISYSNFSCVTNTRNIVPTASYTDAAGPHPLPNFDSTATTFFDVH